MRMSTRGWHWIQIALLTSQFTLIFSLAAQAADVGVAHRPNHEEIEDPSAPLPPPVSELAQSGLQKARGGDHLAAIEDYDRAIQQDSRDAHAYAFRSQSLRALGDDVGAQIDIEQVLQIHLEEQDQQLMMDPDDAEGYAARAATLLSLGDTLGAVDDYSTSLQLRPRHAPTLFELGNARYRAGDPTGALNAYRRSLAADRFLVETYVARALVRLDLGDVAGANADLRIARRFAPTDQVTLGGDEEEIP
jgi:tetratricopeptide (TPR) repeat protein